MKRESVTPMNAQRLGAAIRARRERLGISQAELGKRVKMDQTTISRIERAGPDSRIPPPDVLNPMARALDMPVAVLLRAASYDLDAPETPGDVSIETLIDQINGRDDLPPRARRVITDMIRVVYPD